MIMRTHACRMDNIYKIRNSKKAQGRRKIKHIVKVMLPEFFTRIWSKILINKKNPFTEFEPTS